MRVRHSASVLDLVVRRSMTTAILISAVVIAGLIRPMALLYGGSKDRSMCEEAKKGTKCVAPVLPFRGSVGNLLAGARGEVRFEVADSTAEKW